MVYVRQNSKVTAGASAVALTAMLVMIFVADDVWPWQILYGMLALLLVLKVAVAWRAGRPNVTHFEQSLRRLAFVDKSG